MALSNPPGAQAFTRTGNKVLFSPTGSEAKAAFHSACVYKLLKYAGVYTSTVRRQVRNASSISCTKLQPAPKSQDWITVVCLSDSSTDAIHSAHLRSALV